MFKWLSDILVNRRLNKIYETNDKVMFQEVLAIKDLLRELIEVDKELVEQFNRVEEKVDSPTPLELIKKRRERILKTLREENEKKIQQNN